MAAGQVPGRRDERAIPIVVLGAVAAERLGIARTGVLVWLGAEWFTVVGILQPLELAPDLDRAALIGLRVAESLLGADGLAQHGLRAHEPGHDRRRRLRPARDRQPREPRGGRR